jgi:hypothetical protein
MRGFDPASEDDMDDNGMSRYMENDGRGKMADGRRLKEEGRWLNLSFLD